MTISAKKIAHVNLNVSSVNQGLRFHTESLKMRNVGHIQVAAQDGLPIGIESSVKWRGYRFNSISENLNATTFQLVEWEHPIATLAPYARANNAGISRIAIKVPNLDEIYQQLKDVGVEIFDEPKIDKHTDEHFFCALNADGSIYQFIEGIGEPELWFVNINCSNIEISMRWYQQHFGFEIVSEVWEQEGTGRSYGIAGKIKLKTVRLQLPGRHADCGLQLQQWDLPATAGTQTYQVANNLGFNRLALEVEDVQQSYQDLLAEGVNFSMPPVVFETGKKGSDSDPWVTLLSDPDGATIALMQNEVLG
ncbi:MAG: catechol 2,3-dioxygenase-like lactoylglutathione lyase family enzyme [Pseudomonadales bacterium]|jgi:catechol 2,3-dioxygenase-like lactoylglutathione lyase family enzyme